MKEIEKKVNLVKRLTDTEKILAFFEGVDFVRVQDMSADDVEHIIETYSKYIESVEAQFKKNLPKTRKGLEKLVEQLGETGVKLTYDTGYIDDAIKLNDKVLFMIPRNYATYDRDFGPFNRSQAFAYNYLKIVQNACKENSVHCPDFFNLEVKNELIDKLVDLDTRSYRYNEASIKRGLVVYQNETVIVDNKNAYVFYVNFHPFVLYAGENGNPEIALLEAEGDSITEIEMRCFERNEENIAQVAAYAVAEKFKENVNELFSYMKMSVSRDRKKMTVMLGEKNVFSFDEKNISEALNYDAETHMMHGDLYGYCEKFIAENGVMEKVKEELSIPEFSGLAEWVDKQFLNILVPIVDKKLHVMPEVSLSAVYYSKKFDGRYLRCEHIKKLNKDDRRVSSNQCIINGKPYGFDFRGGKVCGLYPTAFDVINAVEVESVSNGEEEWVMNHYKEIREKLDALVADFKEKEFKPIPKKYWE